jgi:HD-like signal output (HDOD) protein
MADLASYLQSVKLPVMPEVALALIRTLDNPEADIPMVRGVIEKDPALTTSLLRMANSAMFGLSRSVTSLESAISVVGMAHIRARALSICIANAFVLPPELNRLEFWRDCMVCAGYAKWLAGHTKQDEAQAWLTGMMVRLGEVVIAQRSPHLLAHIEQLPRAPGERWARERHAIGFDEGQITAELAHRWDFPDGVSQALAQCSQPLGTPVFVKLAGVLHLAALLSDQAANGTLDLDGLPATVLAALQLSTDKLQPTLPPADAFSDISMLQN